MTEQHAAREAVGTILVGCGNRGVNAHGLLARQSPALELVAVCDVDAARLRAAPARTLIGPDASWGETRQTPHRPTN